MKPLRAGTREIPHARHLTPAVIVAGAHDQQIVAGGERDDFAAGRRRETQRLGSTIDDLEAVDSRDDEGAEVIAMIAPILRQRGDTDAALTLDRAEDPHHPLGTPPEAVARQRLDGTDRNDMLAIHTPLDSR